MIDAAMSYESLKDFLDYERPSDVIKWLDTNHVPYRLSRKKPVTTLSAINKVLMGDNDEDEIEFM